MQCGKCGTDNREGRRFCAQCGAALTGNCTSCGASNEPGEKFCGQCGAELGAAAEISSTPLRVGPAGERRHLTVLFCDLVGSTAIAAQLDPEEWREAVSGYHQAASEAITRFGGHVAKYLGDGVMAFFGYPEAHDNDAERAARAGLAVIEAVAKLNEQPGRPKLAARVGIDSGAVVVGGGVGKEADVFGDTPNISARVQEAAAPGSVLVTEDTHRLISGLFVVEERGAPALKGIDRPIQLYRLVQPSGVRGRLEAVAATRGLTPFVGREDELRLLQSRWQRVLEGEGQVALIIGEAGIGKSRLVVRFHELIADTPHTSIEAGAAPLFQNTPFYPVSEMLRQALGWRGTEQTAQLEQALERAGLKPADALPLLAPLLNLALPPNYAPSPLTPEQQRRRLLATLVEWALGLARRQPTVITTEDLHWADPSTLELMQLLVEQCAQTPLLLLYTARPEFRAPWPLRAHHAQLTLDRLGARDVRAMVREVAARKALSDDAVDAVIARTGGVPLFVEELTRAVLERGDANPGGREIPATLHDSLMARLDRLGPAKEVLQAGAVIGGEFSYELLRAIHPTPEADLEQALRVLADAELLYVRGIAPEATYQFKHALIRDVAYEALLKSRRKDLHRHVAHTISEQFTSFGEAHPEVLARHWTEAADTEAAFAQWSKAGESARARNAFREAQESYQQALAMLKLLPASPERDMRELEIRQSVVQMLWVTRGYSAAETIDATEALAAVAEKGGNLRQLFNLMVSRSMNLYMSGDLRGASMLDDHLLELAVREGSSTSMAHAHYRQILSRIGRADLAGAEKHFAAWLKFSNDPGMQALPGAGIIPLGFVSGSAWMLGRADLARERESQLIAVADPTNPYEGAFAAIFSANLRLLLRDHDEQAAALAAQALQISEENRFPFLVAYSQFLLGLARARLGHASEGVALISQAIAGVRAIGATGNIHRFSVGLAQAQALEGNLMEALATIEQVLEANAEERLFRPEALSLQAELLVKLGEEVPAETAFHEALALAQKTGAKGWELRATMSLARLLDGQGRRDEARALLAEIYNWFTEGFDTADLKDAKALLEELSR